MTTVSHTNVYSLKDYGKHLKMLPPDDKFSRFGFLANDYTIDQLILQMLYAPNDHELWYAEVDDTIVGWGHMAKVDDKTWELAVSVNHDSQRKGVGNKLIDEMLLWAKFHKINEVFMHCIEENKVIQHLAAKHNLKSQGRSAGERSSIIELPDPSFFEAKGQLWKEHSAIMNEIMQLRQQLAELWVRSI